MATITTTTITEPEVVNTEGAAAIVGLHPTTLATMRYRGGGPKFIRVGARRVVYKVADLRAWRDAHGTATSTAEADARQATRSARRPPGQVTIGEGAADLYCDPPDDGPDGGPCPSYEDGGDTADLDGVIDALNGADGGAR